MICKWSSTGIIPSGGRTCEKISFDYDPVSGFFSFFDQITAFYNVPYTWIISVDFTRF